MTTESSSYPLTQAVSDWLMAGSPAIRWQVLRALEEADRVTWQREQTAVAEQGWGARLLRERETTGTWGGKRRA